MTKTNSKQDQYLLKKREKGAEESVPETEQIEEKNVAEKEVPEADVPCNIPIFKKSNFSDKILNT